MITTTITAFFNLVDLRPEINPSFGSLKNQKSNESQRCFSSVRVRLMATLCTGALWWLGKCLATATTKLITKNIPESQHGHDVTWPNCPKKWLMHGYLTIAEFRKEPVTKNAGRHFSKTNCSDLGQRNSHLSILRKIIVWPYIQAAFLRDLFRSFLMANSYSPPLQLYTWSQGPKGLGQILKPVISTL
jgi:hypothetical protein